MAITFRASTSANQLSGASIAVNKPTGTVNNDVIEVTFISDSGGVMSLAGWTSIAAADGTAMRSTTLRRIASGEGASWTFNCSAGNAYTAVAATYTGEDTTTPEAATGALTAGTASPVTAPDITTSADNAWHLAIFTTGSSQTTLAGPPAGYTNDVPTAGGNGDIIRIDHKAISPAGATGAQTSATQTGNNIGISIAIRVAGATQNPFTQRSDPNPIARTYPIDSRSYIDPSEFWLFVGKDVQFAGPGQWMTYDWTNPVATTYQMTRWPIANRTFTDVFKQQLVNKDAQFGGPGQWKSYDYPNPTLKRDDINRRTWTDWYKQQLIGKDTFFSGSGSGPDYDWPNPVLKKQDVNQRTHWWNPLQQLLSVVVLSPFALLDWPNPFRARHPHQGYADSYKQTLLGQDALPFRQSDYPNPSTPRQPQRTDFWQAPLALTSVVVAAVARLFGRLGFAKDINLNPPMGSGVDEDL